MIRRRAHFSLSLSLSLSRLRAATAAVAAAAARHDEGRERERERERARLSGALNGDLDASRSPVFHSQIANREYRSNGLPLISGPLLRH